MFKHLNFGKHIWMHTSKIKHAHFKISSQDEVFTLLFFFFSSRNKIPCLPFWEGVYTWNFIPGWNSSREGIIPIDGEMFLTVYTFLPRWNFIPGWTHPCQKDRDEISSRDEEKKKRCVNTSSRDEILKWACFFNFWRMYSHMLSKVDVFEHNESMNIMKHKASL